MKWNITERHAGMTVYNYLYRELSFSNRLIKRAKSEGNLILVNGVRRTVRYILNEGDKLHVKFAPEEKGPFMTAERMPLSIVYEDEHLIVIDKQPGILTIPSKRHPRETIANGLIHYYEQNNLPYTAHIVTRLDRDTSGLLLVAKHQYSHSLLARLQMKNDIKRKYKALVHGYIEQSSGEINAPIGRKSGSIIERAVTEDGRDALTLYQVEKRYGRQYTLVDIELKTGRTHQIRVHFSHTGHPLVGDDLYGHLTSSFKRQALHCSELIFEHPFTKKMIQIQSELFDDLQTFISEIET